MLVFIDESGDTGRKVELGSVMAEMTIPPLTLAGRPDERDYLRRYHFQG